MLFFFFFYLLSVVFIFISLFNPFVSDFEIVAGSISLLYPIIFTLVLCILDFLFLIWF